MVVFHALLGANNTTHVSLSELFTSFTSNVSNVGDTVVGSSDATDNIPGIVRNLKKGVRLLVIIISSLTIVYITKYMYIIPEIFRNGILSTIVKYPVFSILSIIINSVITTVVTYTNCNRYIEKMQSMVTKEPILGNSVWKNAPELCGKNIEEMFLDIHSRCNGDSVTEIDSKLEEELETGLKKKVGYSVKAWGVIHKKIFQVFLDKYTEFNKRGDKLNSVATRVEKIKSWEKNTKILLETFEDKSVIQNSIDKYLEKQLVNLDYAKLSHDYNIAYCELKTMLKYISPDPNPELFQKCSICITNLKDSFLIPCGHTACHSCLERSKTNNKIICPHCRTESTKIGKIYY